MWVAGVLLAFILPVIYIVIKEWRSRKASEKDNGPPVKKKPLDRRALAGVSVILFALILPSIWLSDISYSFYRKEDAALKVAFKHSGGRVAECDEADLIKKEGERYRRELEAGEDEHVEARRLFEGETPGRRGTLHGRQETA